MFDKLDFIEGRYDELNKSVSDPEVIADNALWSKLCKELSDITPIVEEYKKYKKAKEDIAEAKAYLGLSQEEGLVWGMIRGCMGSVSRLCVIQMQDYLELGGEARMNFPGTLSASNWTWRAEQGFITEELTRRIFETTRRYGRLS